MNRSYNYDDAANNTMACIINHIKHRPELQAGSATERKNKIQEMLTEYLNTPNDFKGCQRKLHLQENIILSCWMLFPLILKRKKCIPSQLYDDALQCISEQVLKAIEKYDPNMKVLFTSFASKYIWAGIKAASKSAYVVTFRNRSKKKHETVVAAKTAAAITTTTTRTAADDEADAKYTCDSCKYKTADITVNGVPQTVTITVLPAFNPRVAVSTKCLPDQSKSDREDIEISIDSIGTEPTELSRPETSMADSGLAKDDTPMADQIDEAFAGFQPNVNFDLVSDFLKSDDQEEKVHLEQMKDLFHQFIEEAGRVLKPHEMAIMMCSHGIDTKKRSQKEIQAILLGMGKDICEARISQIKDEIPKKLYKDPQVRKIYNTMVHLKSLKPNAVKQKQPVAAGVSA